MGWSACLLNALQNELTWPTPISTQLEPGDPTLEHDVLDNLDLLGCAKCDPRINKKQEKI